MMKIFASLGASAFAAFGLAGAAFAEQPYSPPVQAPTLRYVLPAEALVERSALPSGIVFEGRSVQVGRPSAIDDLPEAPAFPSGLPLKLEPNPHPASNGSIYQTMYA
jgi:hypothetical protein